MKIKDNGPRGSGRSHQQLVEAKTNALFIWHNDYLEPARDIAVHAKRPDIVIAGASALTRYGSERYHGIVFSEIILDHACDPSNDELAVLAELRARCCKEPA